MNIQPVPFPQAWTPQEMKRDRSRWVWELGADDLACIDTALEAAKARNLKIPFAASEFPVGALALKLEKDSADKLSKMGVKIVDGVDKAGFMKAAQPVQDQLAAELGPHAVKLLKMVRDEK